jgi:hypothetical protein
MGRKFKFENLVGMLRRIQRWRPEVAKTAAFFAQVSVSEMVCKCWFAFQKPG